ncbi:hypothetical protein FQA39_LY16171 [Lamprigera yunnana]|nr:hypothetical protein FQA39_LY16171 [Lamprigera yunnana]
MPKELRDKREQIKARAARLEKYFQKIKSDEASVDLNVSVLRKNLFETSWADFETIQSELELIDPTKIETNERDEFENRKQNPETSLGFIQFAYRNNRSANIVTLSITESNYEIVYDLILSRYDNKILIIKNHGDGPFAPAAIFGSFAPQKNVNKSNGLV